MVFTKNRYYEKNYIFRIINFSSYHHTDNRCGAPHHYFAYMIKGESRLVSENTEIYAPEGSFFYIPKGLPYQSYWYGSDNVTFVSLGFEHMPWDDETSFVLQNLSCDAETGEKIIKLGHEKELNAEGLSTFFDICAILMSKMKTAAKNTEPQILKRVKNYIEENPFASVSEAAAACYASPSYVYKIFRDSGSTPNEYRQKVICDAAAELLVSTDKKTEEIAELFNLSSASYLRKLLKKHFGKTPREIRKNSVI